MKYLKAFILLAFLMMYTILIAQERYNYRTPFHTKFEIKSRQHNDFWLKATAKDTSNPFQTNGNVTIDFWGADTSGTDSVHAKGYYQTRTKHGWSTQSTFTLASDSTGRPWVPTATVISNRDTARVIIEGLTGNKQKSYVKYELEYDGVY